MVGWRRRTLLHNLIQCKAAVNYLPTRCTDHSCWHRGHRLFCFTHRLMQQLWKEWLHSPQITTQSSCLFSPWHRKHASMTCTLQIAQVSHSTSQLHMATAFHFFRVNIFSGFWVSLAMVSASPSLISVSLLFIATSWEPQLSGCGRDSLHNGTVLRKS